MKYVWVVATNQKEAQELLDYGYETEAEAEEHLKECRKPPADPFYGNQLHVYKVEVEDVIP